VSVSPERERALEFIRWIEDRNATVRQAFAWGTALFNQDFPKVYDLNFLRVDGHPRVTAEELIAQADRLQGSAGLEHRKVVINDQWMGERLAPSFEAAGWSLAKLVIMVRRRPVDRRFVPGSAREIELETMKRARRLGLELDESFHDEETIDQLEEMCDLLVNSGNARCFGVPADDKTVATAELYSDGRTAQIEAVFTLVDYRRKGHGRAVVALALQEAVAAGNDFIFMLADADDWPKDMYERMGFDPAGYLYDFHKSPKTPAAADR